jgi:hypothetical protein
VTFLSEQAAGFPTYRRSTLSGLVANDWRRFSAAAGPALFDHRNLGAQVAGGSWGGEGRVDWPGDRRPGDGLGSGVGRALLPDSGARSDIVCSPTETAQRT